MKLNYTSLQHAVGRSRRRAPKGAPLPTEGRGGDRAPRAARRAWHGKRSSAPGRADRLRPDLGRGAARLRSRVVRELRDRGLLAGHITAGPRYGGEHEAISTEGAMSRAREEAGSRDRRPGPGHPRLGHRARPRRHGGARSAHAALALGCKPLIVPRMSAGTRAQATRASATTPPVLELLLAPVRRRAARAPAAPGRHKESAPPSTSMAIVARAFPPPRWAAESTRTSCFSGRPWQAARCSRRRSMSFERVGRGGLEGRDRQRPR